MPMPRCLAGLWRGTARCRWVATTPLPCRRRADSIHRAQNTAPGSFCRSGSVTALLHQHGRRLGSERVRGSKRPLHSYFGPLSRHATPLADDRQRPGPVIDLVGPEAQGAHWMLKGGWIVDQAEESLGRSLERVWVTALKIPMPSSMTHVIITYVADTPAVTRAHATPPMTIKNPKK